MAFTFDEICDSQEFDHDEKFVLAGDYDVLVDKFQNIQEKNKITSKLLEDIHSHLLDINSKLSSDQSLTNAHLGSKIMMLLYKYKITNRAPTISKMIDILVESSIYDFEIEEIGHGLCHLYSSPEPSNELMSKLNGCFNGPGCLEYKGERYGKE